MKFLMIILLVLAVIWLWRTKRPGLPPSKKTTPTATNPLTMVACVHCSVHVPAGDTVPGKKGLYCSEEHRRASEE
jgi:uncharacterized protein